VWTSIATFQYTQPVEALWLLAEELLPTQQLIKLQATGDWQCFGAHVPACGPRGYLDFNVSSDQLALPESPPGALIGKLGGSDSGRKDGTVFPIGRFCIISPLEKRVPLFVAVNGAWRTGAFTFTALQLEIFVATP